MNILNIFKIKFCCNYGLLCKSKLQVYLSKLQVENQYGALSKYLFILKQKQEFHKEKNVFCGIIATWRNPCNMHSLTLWKACTNLQSHSNWMQLIGYHHSTIQTSEFYLSFRKNKNIKSLTCIFHYASRQKEHKTLLHIIISLG